MRTFRVSNSSLSLDFPKLMFGTTYLGNMEDVREGFRQMDRYLELGGSCIDTARVYSNLAPEDKRSSESVIGEWMKANGCRQQVLISTKGGHPPYGNMHCSRLSAQDLEYDLSCSLEDLQTDYVDLYWLHRDDETLPVGPIMETLDRFVKQGMVRMLGVSNWSLERIQKANAYAAEHGLTPLSTSQIQWSLGYTTPEIMGDDTLVCMNEQSQQKYGQLHLPVFAFEAQAKGLFSKLGQMEEEKLPAKVRSRFLGDQNRSINLTRWEKVKQLAEQYGVSPAVISLAYITCHPVVDAGAIIGCSNLTQLEDSMGAADFLLSPEQVQWLGE